MSEFRVFTNLKVYAHGEMPSKYDDSDTSDALSNYDIPKVIKANFPQMMKKFGGVYLWDEIKKIPKLDLEKWGVILCTLKTKDPPGKIGHWVSLVIDNEKQKFLYYDSFGDNPLHMKSFVKYVRHLKKYPQKDYQLKINGVINQRITTSTCGYFAILFLRDILLNEQTFKEATDFNTLEGEERARLLRNKFRSI